MVGKNKIKELEFKKIEDYFNYIIDSKLNGQRKQAQELYSDLSSSQKSDFRNYLENFFCTAKDINELLNYLTN